MIHKKADVQSVNIGENTNIWQFAVILKDAVIGANCNINCHTFIENNVIIGNNVTIKAGVYLWSGITVEDNVFIGPNATFVNDTYPRSKQYKKFKGALIKKGASIGANATILGNLTIGEYSMIGAGSVVVKSTPKYSLWVGNPAKQVGYITKDGVTLDMNFRNKKTGDVYFFDKTGELVLMQDN